MDSMSSNFYKLTLNMHCCWISYCCCLIYKGIIPDLTSFPQFLGSSKNSSNPFRDTDVCSNTERGQIFTSVSFFGQSPMIPLNEKKGQNCFNNILSIYKSQIWSQKGFFPPLGNMYIQNISFNKILSSFRSTSGIIVSHLAKNYSL